MIDIEQAVFNKLRTVLKQKDSSVTVLGEYTRKKPEFPCVVIIELDNNCYKSSQDDTSMENHALVSYQIDIYCDGQEKKKDCKELMSIVDTEMLKMLFNRDFLQYLTNEEEDQLCRMTSRYSAIVGKDIRIYN
jgi:hypothetical protein